MFTLHTLTEHIRTILKWFAIIGGALLLIFLLFKAGFAVKNVLFPKTPPAPTVTFGKIPEVVFPQSVSTDQFNYTIDTLTGKLPVFTDRIAVYTIDQPKPNLLNLNKAKSRVASVGFTKKQNTSDELQAIALSDSVYQWNDESDLSRTIIMDINLLSFTLGSQFSINEAVLSARLLADEQYAINTAEDFLTDMNLLPKDFNPEKTKTELLRFENGALTSASSLSNAQIIRVDFFQQDIDKLSIVYPEPPHSAMNFYIASGTNDAEVIQANYLHQTIGTDSATYPIKTAQEALDALKNSTGYIGAYFGSNTEILIKDIRLAYYLGTSVQKYLMPVYVFEGNDGFTAYVHALKDNWIEIGK